MSYEFFVNNNKTKFISKCQFRIMTYNVEGFKKYDEVLEVLSNSQADIIGLNEALFFNDELRNKFQSDMTRLNYNIKMCNNYGINVILSKYPIEFSKVIKLEKDPIKNRNRYMLHVKICNINIILTHLDAFDSTGQTRFNQIQTIGAYIKSDFIVMGDFNSIKGTNVINYLELGFRDSFTILGKQQPIMTSWTNRVIDFIFIGSTFPFRVIETAIYPSIASDHFPVYIDIV
jgi:endonuclease/exonuclease/phosphatase family metal-dependent hydrolase